MPSSEKHSPGLSEKNDRAHEASSSARASCAVPNTAAPASHVFPANGYCSKQGGDLHFDTEGLTRTQLRANVRALSFILSAATTRKKAAAST